MATHTVSTGVGITGAGDTPVFPAAIVSGGFVGTAGETFGVLEYVGQSFTAAVVGTAGTTQGNLAVEFSTFGLLCSDKGFESAALGGDPNLLAVAVPSCAAVGDIAVLWSCWRGGSDGYFVAENGWSGAIIALSGTDLHAQSLYSYLTFDQISAGVFTFNVNDSTRTGTSGWLLTIYRALDYIYADENYDPDTDTDPRTVTPPEVPTGIGGGLEDDWVLIYGTNSNYNIWSVDAPYTQIAEPEPPWAGNDISFTHGYYELPAADDPHQPSDMDWVLHTDLELISATMLLRHAGWTYTVTSEVVSPTGETAGTLTVSKQLTVGITGTPGETAGTLVLTPTGNEIEVCLPSTNFATISNASANSVTVSASSNSVTVNASKQDVC